MDVGGVASVTGARDLYTTSGSSPDDIYFCLCNCHLTFIRFWPWKEFVSTGCI